MILLPRHVVAEMLVAEMPGAQFPAMWSANQYVCPKLSWIRGDFQAQLDKLLFAYRLNSSGVAGRPICDVIRKAMDFMLAADMAVTADAWANGVDTSAAFFGLRVLLPPGVNFLGIGSPVGGGHDTGLLIVEDDADLKDGKPRLYHKEPQTAFDCPLSESLEKLMLPVEVRD